jgi:hypothetical protein
VKARDLRLLAVALGGFGLVVAAHGSGPDQPASVTVEGHAGSSPDGGGNVVAGGEGVEFGGLGANLQRVVNDQSIRLLDFGEIDQPGDACAGGPVQVPQVITVAGGASGLLDRDHVVELQVDGDVAYGDVDADGLDEAVVHTVCAFGANGAIDNVQVWDLDSGIAVAKASVGEPPASLTGPFPPTVTDVQVVDGTLEVTWTHYGDDDPNCCPSSQTTLQYVVDGSEVTQVGDPRTSAAG